MKVLREEPQQEDLVGKSIKKIREPSLSSEDESVEWMNGMPRNSQNKENATPEGLPRKGISQKRQMEDGAPQKLGPWMSLDAASAPGVTPRSGASDPQRPTLSMTPRSVSRQIATTPRSMTPRSSIRDATPRGSITHDSTPRLKPSPSAPFLTSRRDAACQVTPLATTPRGELMPRSATPRGGGVSGTTPRGDATPRAMTPRGSGVGALSMMPQLISRRGSTPRGSTPGSSTRGMRRSASEVVITRNS